MGARALDADLRFVDLRERRVRSRTPPAVLGVTFGPADRGRRCTHRRGGAEPRADIRAGLLTGPPVDRTIWTLPMRRAIPPFASSLAALLAGLALGLVLRGGAPLPLSWLAAGGVWVGTAWLALLSLLAVPVSAACLLSAIGTAAQGASVGRLLGATVTAIVAALAAMGLLTFAVLRPLLQWAIVPLGPGAVAAGDAAAGAPAGGGVAALLGAASIAAPLTSRFLPLLLATAAAGLLLARLRGPAADRARRVVAAASDWLLGLVRLLMRGLSAGLFAIGVVYGESIGWQTAGILGQFTVVTCTALLVATVALYPFVAAAGRIAPRAFARAAWPAQVVAVSTRSSIAALPAALEGAQRHLALNATGRAVLPVATSIFKLNRAVSATAKLVFVAHVYGVPLAPATVATFLATVIVQSFGALGVPGGGTSFKTLPAYVAAGLPIEVIVLLEAAEAATDVFKTLLNVTANLGLAVVLARTAPVSAPAVVATGVVAES
jgi:proton glutamate symport protein